MNEPRLGLIRAALTARFAPEFLEIEDDSHLHAGHAGARDGRGHFRVSIIAEAFEGLGRVQRHQLVYSALADLMESDIHALSIDARSPAEL